MFEARFKRTLEELQFLTLGLCQRWSPRKRWLACHWSPPKQLEAAFTLCIWLKVASIVIKVCLQLKYWGQCVARKTWLIRINKPKVQQEKTPSITPLLVLTICTRQVGPLIHAADSESWAVNNRRAASSDRTDLFSSGEPLHHICFDLCRAKRCAETLRQCSEILTSHFPPFWRLWTFTEAPGMYLHHFMHKATCLDMTE